MIRNVMFATTTLAVLAFAVAAPAATIDDLLAEEQFVGYDWGEYLDGQQTSSTIGFDGEETWDAVDEDHDARGYQPVEQGLSYPGLASAGGAVEAYRTSNFRQGDNASGNSEDASLVPGDSITETGDALYLSALINADGYTAREDDLDIHGVDVLFRHESGGRRLGFGFGGESGGDEEKARTVRLRTQSEDRLQLDAEEVGNDEGLTLAEGTNLLVLSIERPGGTGDNTYRLWLNPDLYEPMGDPDFTHTEDWGIVVGCPSWGFFGFELRQSFNYPQSVLVDELRFGESWAAVTIPEPATLGLLGIGGLAVVLKRRR